MPPKLVRRRETLATRKLRARLAKERQGTNGKWESNKKKAAARLARRQSLKLNPIFKGLHAQKACAEAEALKRAMAKTHALKTVSDASALLGIIAELDKLQVSANLLKQTKLPKVLQEAVRRFPAALGAGHRLRTRWRDVFRQDLAKLQEAAASPSAAVAKVKPPAGPGLAPPEEARRKQQRQPPAGPVVAPSEEPKRKQPRQPPAAPVLALPEEPKRKPQRQQRITAFLKASAGP